MSILCYEHISVRAEQDDVEMSVHGAELPTSPDESAVVPLFMQRHPWANIFFSWLILALVVLVGFACVSIFKPTWIHNVNATSNGAATPNNETNAHTNTATTSNGAATTDNDTNAHTNTATTSNSAATTDTNAHTNTIATSNGAATTENVRPPTLEPTENVESLRCCWNRWIQICAQDSQCDAGGEGCVLSGTITKQFGAAHCVGPLKFQAQSRHMHCQGPPPAKSMSVELEHNMCLPVCSLKNVTASHEGPLSSLPLLIDSEIGRIDMKHLFRAPIVSQCGSVLELKGRSFIMEVPTWPGAAYSTNVFHFLNDFAAHVLLALVSLDYPRSKGDEIRIVLYGTQHSIHACMHAQMPAHLPVHLLANMPVLSLCRPACPPACRCTHADMHTCAHAHANIMYAVDMSWLDVAKRLEYQKYWFSEIFPKFREHGSVTFFELNNRPRDECIHFESVEFLPTIHSTCPVGYGDNSFCCIQQWKHARNRVFSTLQLPYDRTLQPEWCASLRKTRLRVVIIQRTTSRTGHISGFRDLGKELESPILAQQAFNDSFNVQQVDFGQISAQEQLAILNSADILVGSHGAALAQSLFWSENTAQIQILAGHMCGWNSARIMNKLAVLSGSMPVNHCLEEHHIQVDPQYEAQRDAAAQHEFDDSEFNSNFQDHLFRIRSYYLTANRLYMMLTEARLMMIAACSNNVGYAHADNEHNRTW